MNRHTISLGRILGIPISLDYSWFLIFGLITWTMAVGYYPAEYKNWPIVQYWIVAAVSAIMLFVSVLLHELGHSAVAMYYKIRVRSITLFIFGGISQIETEPTGAMAQLWLSLAGPAVSFALAVFFFLLQAVFTDAVPLLALGKYLVYINIVLGVFNLIPGFPLDGGGVVRAVVWGITRNRRRATLIAANLGRFIAYFFIILGVWQMFAGNLELLKSCYSFSYERPNTVIASGAKQSPAWGIVFPRNAGFHSSQLKNHSPLVTEGLRCTSNWLAEVRLSR